MTVLRASFVASLAATFLAFGSPVGAFADGRGDWDNYAWQKIAIKDCRPVDSALACPAYHEKWDWKRNQWVDIAITIDIAAGQLHLTQRLTDRDSYDDDDVCVTALVVDAGGQDIIAHHQNWRMVHGKVREDSFTYRSSRLADAATIHIGSKQCRDGARQDDDVYARVLAGIVD